MFRKIYYKSTLTKELLSKHINKTFIETGTSEGRGCDLAIELGFNEVRSVEADESLYSSCFDLFKSDDKIKLYLGKSEEKLPEMISEITHECTFWLDAHNRGSCPVLRELDVIKEHPIKTHTILIDDMQSFDAGWLEGITRDDLIKKLKEINSDYVFSYEKAFNSWNDNILVAKIIKI